MKKQWLASTALCAVAGLSLAAPAAAQDKMKIGIMGFAKQEFGYVWQRDFDSTAGAPSDRSGFDQQSDVEIQFRGQLKLDNGITVLVHVDLEGETSADQIDEQYMRIFGSFGDIRLGALNAAPYLMSYFAPNYGVGIDEAFIQNYISYPGGGFAGTNSVFMQTARIVADNDGNKIAYFTPRLFGFQAGVSYTPDLAQDDDAFRSGNLRYRDAVSVALNYDNKFGPLYLAGNVGFFYADAPVSTPGTGAEDLKAFNVGANIGYAGFLLGGEFQRYMSGSVISSANSQTLVAGTSARGTVWNVGGAYSFGPYGVSLAYYSGSNDGFTAVAGKNEAEWLMLSGKYALGPGIDLYGSIAHASYDDDIKTTSVGDNDGWATIGGIRITF